MTSVQLTDSSRSTKEADSPDPEMGRRMSEGEKLKQRKRPESVRSEKSDSTEQTSVEGNHAHDVSTPKAALTKSTTSPTPYRYDVVLWLFGILFMCVLGCAIIGIGEYRGWDAYSAYNHNSSNNSMDRFLPKPFTPEPGVYKRSDKEASSRWYYWKLKPSLVHPGTKLFVWAGYCLHNLSVWLVLYLQHKSKTYPEKGAPLKKYSSVPSKYNLALFGINVFFHLLHLVNTHTTYDGTAADTSEASSQSSVIVALILILFIEFSERGVVFGYPSPNQLRKSLNSIWMSPVYLFRKFHGYFIYWAAIFTFWYHPMESTPGHVFGFAHTWFFMLQGSLAFTNAHLNKYWRMMLEIWVAIHSGIVAYQTVPYVMGKELWPMFFFGFATAWILTQFYGLPFWKNIPSWSRAIPVSIFVAFSITAYSYILDTEGRPYTRLAEIIRIPGIYYLLLLVGWLVIVAAVKIGKMINSRRTETQVNISEKTEPAGKAPPPLWKEIIILSGVVLTYVISVFLSWILEYLDLPLNLIVFTMIYCFIFTLVSAIGGSLLLSLLIPVKTIQNNY